MQRRAILGIPLIALAACSQSSSVAPTPESSETELLPLGGRAELRELQLEATETKSTGNVFAVKVKYVNTWRHKTEVAETWWGVYDDKDNYLRPLPPDDPGGPNPRYPAVKAVRPGHYTDGWLVFQLAAGRKPVELIYRNSRGNFASWKLA